jgi:hypothetical protein
VDSGEVARLAEAHALAAATGALPLPNERREAFAQLVAGGAPLHQAYRDVGYEGVDAARLGGGLARTGPVADRIAYLRAQRAEVARTVATVDAARIQTELEHLAFSDVGEVFDLSSEHLRVLPLSRWPERARRAVASVKVKRLVGNDDEPAELVEFKLWPKPDAIRQLREHMGLVGPQGGGTFNNYGVVMMPAMETPQPLPGERILDVEVAAGPALIDVPTPPAPPPAPAVLLARQVVQLGRELAGRAR